MTLRDFLKVADGDTFIRIFIRRSYDGDMTGPPGYAYYFITTSDVKNIVYDKLNFGMYRLNPILEMIIDLPIVSMGIDIMVEPMQCSNPAIDIILEETKYNGKI